MQTQSSSAIWARTMALGPIAHLEAVYRYLRLYATMFECFALVDGDSAGTTATDDRRIDLDVCSDAMFMCILGMCMDMDVR